jgi:integrase/recombinase XerD
MNITKWHEQYCKDARLKYPSERTVENYSCSVYLFLNYFSTEIDPTRINTELIKDWLLTFKTINTRNHKLCAIKSFYEITVGMPLKLNKIPFSKKDKKLPIVLSVDEIQRMFNVCDNLKHKVILGLLYSCGLRVSELINLKWANLNRSRMVINIIQAKGKKDRQVPLDLKLTELLDKYWREYKSKEYVLNGWKDEPQYSERSVGQVIKQLANKAGIDNKRVYTHLIRHCHATHLVEAGTDINIIQRILGHSNVKTTAIYTHISSNLISRVKTPLSSISI